MTGVQTCALPISLFDYFRNGALDAKDWFAENLPKSQEGQNDFGGVLAGPIRKNNTFFFFSYEGLRLHQPSVQETVVPDSASRQQASRAIHLTRFVVTLKKDHGLGSNTILHNAVIVAQFLKRHGRSGITRELQLPERITPLVKVYRHEELARFFEIGRAHV